jgi:hypothetical protein
MPVPAPEVPCRTAVPEEIPKGASHLAELAQGNGWQVWITYARGPWPNRNAPDGFIIHDSIAVRMHREGALVGCWHDGKFYKGLSRSRGYTLHELRELVRVIP